ncbi:VWA domain-containing protein [Agromyces intestinalis]|uniref:VWA domain-containing protein n=1 Tax=Agromyces intestinalis TaxID=2592652 RepID=A0A5C1YH11_9MICO|nr:substrate-binding and VWA domain-containing protein [Agromyces intestinalis]QEO15506.1 VWA domain-containing protein [Agromyces intestinalis]
MAIALTAVIVITGGLIWIGGSLSPLLASAEAGCPSVDEFTVVADPSVVPVVEQIAADFDAEYDGCIRTVIRSQTAADTVALVAAGGLDADVWLPDSSVWIERAVGLSRSLGRPAPSIESRGSIATSPVVFAAPASSAQAIAAEPVTWERILDGGLTAILPDPTVSAPSLAGLLALKARSSDADARQFSAAMVGLTKSIPASTEAAFSSVPSLSEPTVVITSEVLVAQHNLDDDSELLTVAYPPEGTVAVDYPFIAVAAGTRGHKELIKTFHDSLRTSSRIFRAAGFRAPNGSGYIEIEGLSSAAPMPARGWDGGGQVELLKAWAVFSLRSRMLAVIDVSGSMEEPADNGLRRIDIFQQAAGGALAKFSGEVQLGVWVFSTARNGELDYEDLAPIEPLGNAAHLADVQRIVDSLPQRLGGATGLYDTTLAAVQRVRDSYDAEKINTVLLFTDGRNEDENGIDLPTLVAELERLDDRERPVPVIVVGIGPDTDMAALQQIANATGGAAYTATKPEDLSTVLIDALSQRDCRPDCT